jgi:hypothetical protein
MILVLMIRSSLIMQDLVHLIQDSLEDQVPQDQELSTSPLDQGVQRRVQILIQMKYLRCSFLAVVEARCHLMNLENPLLKEAILLQRCLEVDKDKGPVD